MKHFPSYLADMQAEIEGHAKAFGLDIFPILYEVLDYDAYAAFDESVAGYRPGEILAASSSRPPSPWPHASGPA